MRSSLYRRGHVNSEETEPLISSLPASAVNNEHSSSRSTSGYHSPLPDSGRKLPQHVAALTATLGALAAGTMLGWSSPVIYKICEKNVTAYDFPICDSNRAAISSLINLGAAASCIPSGFIMDAIGRKKTMLLLVLPFTVGWLLITYATSVAMLILGRLITGFAGGSFCVTAPTYTSEIGQDSIRGALGTYFQLMVTVGVLFSYIVGSCSPILVFNLLCTSIPIIFGVLFTFMPESPQYLVKRRRFDAARSALITLRGSSYDVDGELERLKAKSEQTQLTDSTFRRNISKKSSLRAVLICYTLMLLQQVSGINAVLFNASVIFNSATTAFSPEIATIFLGIIQVIATFLSSVVVDKLGRRVLLLISAFIMSLCTITIGIYFFLKEHNSVSNSTLHGMAWMPLLSLSIFIIAFSFGYGPIPWMMAGELCLMEIKAFVSSTSSTINWLLSLVVTSSFYSLRETIGTGQLFWFFAGATLCGLVFVFLVVPETKGKSVDEIQVMLGGQSQPEIIVNAEDLTENQSIS